MSENATAPANAVHLTPEQVEDPVRGYADLRTRDELPHAVLPGLTTPVRLVTRYADVKAALTEPRLIRDRTRIPGDTEASDAQDELLEAASAGLPAEYVKYFAGHLALFDGEEHAHRRAPLTRAFTARRIAALRTFVERTADALVAEAEANGGTDLLGAFAYPLATQVICELTGVEERDREHVCSWMRDFAFGDGSRAGEALVALVEYAKELIARRRAEPTEDLISALLDGDVLTEDELIGIVFLLINTGITPPALFLAHAALALLDHPEQAARLHADPELLPRAVPELLRYVSIVRIGATLYATEDFDFAGTALRRGESVTVALLAADHDPEEFGEGAGQLDVGREFGRGDGHLAFGHGAHYCIGAALGRLVTSVVLDRLFVRRDDLRLAVDRAALEFGHWPGDGFHLLRLPIRL
ncbi:cytochrome P450 [Streptomyces sp. Rer75]|uniref:cytochrome P450 n=1 Tax=Streptomyces sp. Rer75 TaxID=2750011 RepID=UPI0015D0CC0A|nr:cytochrome P450 [Streptomyces sp. Rer75]QLH22749.1 cytochrome P450 [Streptomyces sp. Rer75]